MDGEGEVEVVGETQGRRVECWPGLSGSAAGEWVVVVFVVVVIVVVVHGGWVLVGERCMGGG